MNVNAGQDQKRALIQQLLDQYQAHAARAAGLAGVASGPATAAGLPSGRPFGGVGHVTAALPNLAQSLIQRLGPGGIGHPIAGIENSPGRGMPVGIPMAANPHAGGAPNAPTLPVQAAAPAAPIAPTAVPAAPTALADVSVMPQMQNLSAPVNLGNGLMFHPSTGIVNVAGSKLVAF